jgi:ABC-type transport system involved in Fe-S cluster assembly fused permease/ATPase subunit
LREKSGNELASATAKQSRIKVKPPRQMWDGLLYFGSNVGFAFSVVMLLTMSVYVAGTAVITSYTTKARRELNENDIAVEGVITESLSNFHDVKVIERVFFMAYYHSRSSQVSNMSLTDTGPGFKKLNPAKRTLRSFFQSFMPFKEPSGV